MKTGKWAAPLNAAAQTYFNRFKSVEEIKDHLSPWEKLSKDAKQLLSVKNLSNFSADGISYALIELFQDRPRIKARFKGILCFQDGERLKEALIRLQKAREAGDRARKIKAAALGGLGRATASELLCLLRPYRFLPQNAATCGVLGKLLPVYKKRDLSEMPYEAFMELAETLEPGFRSEAEKAWPEIAEKLRPGRYLYFYAFLSELGK